MKTEEDSSPRERAIEICRILRREPEIPENLIAAMLANIAVETGYTYDPTTKQKGRSDPAYGLFQLDPRGGLYDLYTTYMETTHAEDCLETQVHFMTDILLGHWDKGATHIGRGNIKKVMSAAERSRELTTEYFCSLILRPGKPHMYRRLAELDEVAKIMDECGVESWT
jgi:hypothetical protein